MKIKKVVLLLILGIILLPSMVNAKEVNKESLEEAIKIYNEGNPEKKILDSKVSDNSFTFKLKDLSNEERPNEEISYKLDKDSNSFIFSYKNKINDNDEMKDIDDKLYVYNYYDQLICFNLYSIINGISANDANDYFNKFVIKYPGYYRQTSSDLYVKYMPKENNTSENNEGSSAEGQVAEGSESSGDDGNSPTLKEYLLSNFSSETFITDESKYFKVSYQINDNNNLILDAELIFDTSKNLTDLIPAEKNEEIQKKEIVKVEDTGLSTKQYAILGSIIILSGSLILKKKLNN